MLACIPDDKYQMVRLIILVLFIGILSTACNSTQPMQSTPTNITNSPLSTSGTSVALALGTPTRVPEVVEPTLTPTLPNPAWMTRWLQGIPCKAPCWENITPGRTSPTDAIEILLESKLAITASMGTSQFLPDVGYVTWTYAAEPKIEGGALYNMDTPTPVIFAITPGFQPVHLANVIEAYGEPKYVVAAALRDPHGDGVSYQLHCIFWPQGIDLRTLGYDKPILDEQTTFEEVSFFEPTQQNLDSQLAGLANFPEWLLPWQGYKEFDYYCRDLEDGRACRGEPRQ